MYARACGPLKMASPRRLHPPAVAIQTLSPSRLASLPEAAWRGIRSLQLSALAGRGVALLTLALLEGRVDSNVCRNIPGIADAYE